MKKKSTIVFSVLIFHSLLIGVLWLYSPLSPKQKPHKPLAVRTIQIQEESPPTFAPMQPSPTPAPKPTPKSPPTPKPKPTPKPIPPKPAPPAQEEPENTKQQELVALLQQSLKGLESTSSPKAPTLSSEALLFSSTYEEKLIAHLESLLSFPEKGEVKLLLTLSRSGKVEKMEFGQATNSKNVAYLEKRLPTLSLPLFGTHWKGQASHTFTLHLQGD